MTGIDVVYACAGLGALCAAVLPTALARRPVSLPMVFLAAGFLVFLLPLDALPELDPVQHRGAVEHLTEICVVIALMGAGLAINRPPGLRSWSTTWRLLGLAMPLTILVTAAAAGWLMAWPPAVALLVAASLAPTDPVLAAEVRVGEPTDEEDDEDEVRFALTSEAGLNDGLAFPFVLAAVALTTASATGWSATGLWHWAWSDVLLRGGVALLVGVAIGRLLGWMFFQAAWKALRLSEHREGFTALAATFIAYGATELLHGYGFLAVFVTACTIRGAERAHGYHRVMHGFTDQIERLLTAVVLFLVGGFTAQGGLGALTWRGALLGLLLFLVIRPAVGWLVQLRGRAAGRERWATAFFGIRGIGSFFYLAYALGAADFAAPAAELWAVVTFTVLLSALVHGVAATPVTARLDRANGSRPAEPQPQRDTVPQGRSRG
ncbi:cation transporter [Streptomyces sp. CB00455]|uniref:cation:proton antiporter n=1 Tax=Streptomyces sp. CB00455 TaxID=1703927 RepID=UPI00096A0C04|nr:cation:proton antiporter [Streptomyces sp. CB00455]OKK17709.1 cation transporter [Streptomyces sp. CB00455]